MPHPCTCVQRSMYLRRNEPDDYAPECRGCMHGDEPEPEHIQAWRDVSITDWENEPWNCFRCGQDFVGNKCPCKEE